MNKKILFKYNNNGDNMSNEKWKKVGSIALAIIIPLIVGGLSALLTKDAMESFNKLNQPPLSPPSWLFPVVWTVLFILMGISSYIIYKNKNTYYFEEREKALVYYVLQLIFNFVWSLLFFNMKWFVFSFIWLLVLWVLILLLMINAKKVNKIAFYLLIPYLLWVTFAGYLNLGIAILN